MDPLNNAEITDNVSNSQNQNNGLSDWNKELEERNQQIDKLKKRIKMLRENNGSKEQLKCLQMLLNKQFEKLDALLKSNLENQVNSMNPTNIIHLATTTEEDNIPPLMLCADARDGVNNTDVEQQVCRQLSPEQKNAEAKFHQIRKKLLDLCSNDLKGGSEMGSFKDGENNLNNDVKEQFDSLYAELKLLEKDLFHGKDSELDTSDNTEQLVIFENLKRQNTVLIDQGTQFRVLFQEQQIEIENYRKKYMRTLQNVMEQHMRICNLENDSKCTEKKTYEEITRIKNNLKKKLDHLVPMSDMLEKCNRKLVYTMKTKTEMEHDYEDICKELRQLKKELAYKTAGENYKEKCDYLNTELKKSQELNEINGKRISHMQQQLKASKDELDRMKYKSSKTIKSTIKRCDFLRCELQSRVNNLETELAQAKANLVVKLK